MISTTLFSLALSMSVIGCVVYGLTRVVKPLLPEEWRKTSPLGKATMMFIPVLVGGLLAVLVMNNLMVYADTVTGAEARATLSTGGAFVMGMFSGSFASQIHHFIRSRIKTL